MKYFLVILLLSIFAFAVTQKLGEYIVADKTFLKKQKKVLLLFKYINQPTYYVEHTLILLFWSPKPNKLSFGPSKVFDQFWEHYEYNDLLPKGDIFSVFNYDHLQQVKMLFKMFYHASDFTTFHNFAVWCRQNINEGLFLYTISVAIVHRPDTYGIIIPPIYEIYPFYFFDVGVINEAQKYKQVWDGSVTHTVKANYSGEYLNLHPEQSMSYFLEDIGLNQYYYYYNLYHPYWMPSEPYSMQNDRRGEFYFYFYQKIVARFYLERLSNDFGEIKNINWQVPFETPYEPSLRYQNGLEFPSRPKFARLEEYFYNYGQTWTWKGKQGYGYTLINDYEQRVHDAMDSGFAIDMSGEKINLWTKDGLNILGNIIQGNADSPLPNFYGSMEFYARHLLGYAYQPLTKHQLQPSSLEHFETSMRDPAFYQLYKRIILDFQRYMSYKPVYTSEELAFDGVEIVSVDFDRLETFFDPFESDISNAVYVTPSEYPTDNFKVKAKQFRLNHKDFSYNILVKSSKEGKAVVKIFLGPKYDEYSRYMNISENRLNYVEFDHFVHTLKRGENKIKRSSSENPLHGPDRTTYSELYTKVDNAYNDRGIFYLDGTQQYFHFPRRLMLPLGKKQGMPYQFFTIIYPYVEYEGAHEPMGKYFYPRAGSGSFFIDNQPLFYPLDRYIKFENMWHDLPNMNFKQELIYRT
ncbi:unnamed protein product [Brassicogethes aeneus]|uniref:Uncharacterized protein n=1 Tax=Brassicogethes aeneus TaxID=1431903 RepID=A0A9P0BIK4_BRAAE|nr:unnamed protein product [Brassicogethes aeneus]